MKFSFNLFSRRLRLEREKLFCWSILIQPHSIVYNSLQPDSPCMGISRARYFRKRFVKIQNYIRNKLFIHCLSVVIARIKKLSTICQMGARFVNDYVCALCQVLWQVTKHSAAQFASIVTYKRICIGKQSLTCTFKLSMSVIIYLAGQSNHVTILHAFFIISTIFVLFYSLLYAVCSVVATFG